jgi:predicted lipoprotein with Yx(FWY)xxD motif
MTRLLRARLRRLLVIGVAAAALAIVSVAVAASPAPLIQTGKVKVRGQTRTVIVDSRGMTLYTLSDERVGNLKCLTKACFAIWPPYKITANQPLTKAPGIKGTLGRLRRVKGGFYQLMLNGRPLYRFSGDRAKGQANGDGIRSYGGTWRVVTP